MHWPITRVAGGEHDWASVDHRAGIDGEPGHRLFRSLRGTGDALDADSHVLRRCCAARDRADRERDRRKIMPDPQKFLPLTQTSFYIVISLRSGPKHGY